ncbi:MAG: MarR family transcriptional regulator [Lachnospiraceae bacterium]|nr:MarR family transcriptional regulator [Lachnospiraceae bacterium]
MKTVKEGETYDCLRLENQLCFPLYVCAKEIVRRYKPFLDEIDLTYTQYIAMMALWDKKKLNVKELGDMLFLDSGTLTPLLKKMEEKGLLTRTRSKEDERNLIVEITDKGEALKEEAKTIPERLGSCLSMSEEDAGKLYEILHRFMGTI